MNQTRPCLLWEPPHTEPVPEKCHLCMLYATRDDYNRLWGGPGISAPPPVPPPSLARKAVNFAKAVVEHIAAGLPKASEEEKAQRLAICKGCELYNGNVCTHGACGCNLSVKAGWLEQTCPLNKW